MKVNELIQMLSDTMQAVGDVEVKIVQLFEDEDGDDRNSESDISGVYTMCGNRYIYLELDG